MDRFKHMETYAAVVKLGSFTQAVKKLGVTRAMVSKRIQNLEAELAIKLLNRNTHRLSVTGDGAVGHGGPLCNVRFAAIGRSWSVCYQS